MAWLSWMQGRGRPQVPDPSPIAPSSPALRLRGRVGLGELSAVAAGGDLLVVAGRAGLAGVSAETGEERWFAATSGWAVSVSVSADARTVLVGTDAWQALTLDGMSGARRQEHALGAFVAVAVSADGRWTAMSPDGAEILARGPGCELALQGLREGPAALAFSPDGGRLVGADVEGEVVVWELPSGVVYGVQPGGGAPARAVAWDLTSGKIAVARGKELLILDADAGLRRVVALPRGEGRSVAWDGAGAIWVGTDRGSLLRVDAETGVVSPGPRVGFDEVLLAGGGSAPLVATQDGVFRAGAEGLLALPVIGPALALAAGPGGLAVASRAALWRLAGGRVQAAVPGLAGVPVALRHTDAHLFASAPGEAVLADAASGRVIRRWEGIAAADLLPGVVALARCVARPPGVALSVTLEPLDGGAPREIVAGRPWTAPVDRLQVHPDGVALAARGGDALVIWELPEGTERGLAEQVPAGGGVWFPAGVYAQLQGAEDAVVDWAPGQRCPRAMNLASDGPPRAAAVSADGRQAAVAFSTDDGDPVRHWTLEPTHHSQILSDGMGIVAHVLAFHPSGALLAAGYSDDVHQGHLSVWSVPDGRLLLRWDSPKGGVEALAFSADGRQLWAGGRFGLQGWEVALPVSG